MSLPVLDHLIGEFVQIHCCIVSVLNDMANDGRADETGASGDKEFHISDLPPIGIPLYKGLYPYINTCSRLISYSLFQLAGICISNRHVPRLHIHIDFFRTFATGIFNGRNERLEPPEGTFYIGPVKKKINHFKINRLSI